MILAKVDVDEQDELAMAYKVSTVQSVYNIPHFNMKLNITWPCWGSQIFFTVEF